jgi:hypothetical protein
MPVNLHLGGEETGTHVYVLAVAICAIGKEEEERIDVCGHIYSSNIACISTRTH